MLKFASTRRLLQKLDKLFQAYTGSDSTILIAYSKMANLEVCGWLEESFDEIAHNCVRARLPRLEQRKLLNLKIEQTYGFDYRTNARPLLSHALGVVRLLEIEKQMEQDGSLTLLRSTIGNLKPIRRDAAHTSIAGTTETYPAPSVALQRFETCLPLVQKLWGLVR